MMEDNYFLNVPTEYDLSSSSSEDDEDSESDSDFEFSDTDLGLHLIPDYLRSSPSGPSYAEEALPPTKKRKIDLTMPQNGVINRPILLPSPKPRSHSVLGSVGGSWLASMMQNRINAHEDKDSKPDAWSQIDGDLEVSSTPDTSNNPNPSSENSQSSSSSDKLLERYVGSVHEKLRPHQAETIAWVWKRERCRAMPGGLIGLEQGGGKTMIMLAAMCRGAPNLVVMQKSVMVTWIEEAHKWFNGQLRISIMTCESCKSNSVPTVSQMRNCDIILTTYESVLSGYKALDSTWRSTLGKSGVVRNASKWEQRTAKTRALIQARARNCGSKRSVAMCSIFALCWKRVILDESQKLKGNGIMATAACVLPRRNSWLLSGTFMNNTIRDLYVCLRFMGRVSLPGSMTTWEKHLKTRPAARAWMDHFMKTAYIRFTLDELGKRDASMLLPPLKRWSYRCPFLNKGEQQLYNEFRDTLRDDVKDVLAMQRYRNPQNKNSLSEAKGNMLKMLMYMRRAGVGFGAVPTEGFEECESPQYQARSTKMKMMCSYIVKKVKATEKILIFCEWTTALNLAERSLRLLKLDSSQPDHIRNLRWVRLDGQMSADARTSAKKRFKTTPGIRIFLISLRAGNTGLNLPEANHVILLAPWYNPQEEEQALSRAWRPGQTAAAVHVVWLLIEGSCEEDIYALNRRKLSNDDHVHAQQGIDVKHTLTQKLPNIRSAEGIKRIIFGGRQRGSERDLPEVVVTEEEEEKRCASLMVDVVLKEEPKVYEAPDVIAKQHQTFPYSTSSSSSSNSAEREEVDVSALVQPIVDHLSETKLAPTKVMLQKAYLITSYNSNRTALYNTQQWEQKQTMYITTRLESSVAVDMYWIRRAAFKAQYRCDVPLTLVFFPDSTEALRKLLLRQIMSSSSRLGEEEREAVQLLLKDELSLSSDMVLRVLRSVYPTLDAVLFKSVAAADMGQNVSELRMIGRSTKLRLLRSFTADLKSMQWKVNIDMNHVLMRETLAPGGLIPLGTGRQQHTNNNRLTFQSWQP